MLLCSRKFRNPPCTNTLRPRGCTWELLALYMGGRGGRVVCRVSQENREVLASTLARLGSSQLFKNVSKDVFTLTFFFSW